MRKLFDADIIYAGICFDGDESSGSDTGIAEEIADFIDDSGTVGDGEVGDDKEEPSGETSTKEAPSEKPAGESTGDGEVKAEGDGEVTPKVEGEVEDEVTPKEEPIAEPAPTDELSLLRKQVETLQGLVNDLATPKHPAVEDEPKGEGEAPPTVQAMLETIDFDDVMKDKESFVKFFLEAANVIKAEAAQQTLMSLPQVVGSVVHRQTSLREVANAFYATHPELKAVKQYVGRVANEISAANPDLTIQQVLDQAAVKVKETLNIQALVQAADKKAAGKPALGGGTGGAKSKSGPSSGLQSEIDDFISD